MEQERKQTRGTRTDPWRMLIFRAAGGKGPVEEGERQSAKQEEQQEKRAPSLGLLSAWVFSAKESLLSFANLDFRIQFQLSIK